MHLSWILLMTTVCVVCGEFQPRALWQFGKMITCVQPNVDPFIYNNYGCYCGFSGSGSPIDQIDQCCLLHDKCYENARKHPDCPGLANLPYVKVYNFSCSDKTITCSASNDKCQAKVCECDQVAANCFSQHNHTYNPNYKNLQSEECKN
ncbi:phospholipase A2 [Tachysurus ichikawai]